MDLQNRDLRNRHVVVTGGSGALGAAVVRHLLAAGARWRIPVFHDGKGDRLAGVERVEVVPHCDLTDEADVTRLFAGIDDLWASIHLAGGFAMHAVTETTKAELAQMLDVNLVSCYLCCREALRAFRGPGRIVNVAARPALEPRSGGGISAYAASKAAVAAVTQAIAAEVASRDVLVNAVAPSTIDTPANRAAMPRADFDAWPKPAEIAATIAFLASPENTVTTGAIVPVYGRA